MLGTVRSSLETDSPVPAALGTASPLGFRIAAYHTSGSGIPATRLGFLRVTTVGEVHRGNLCYVGGASSTEARQQQSLPVGIRGASLGRRRRGAPHRGWRLRHEMSP